MSLSQKHVGKVFVPWFNTAEWKHVYNILCSQSDKNYTQALYIFKIWKNRTPLLSAGVEGTLTLLEALLTEKKSLSEHQLAQIYAISLMRFLNLCATSNEKQGTFYKTALRNELPKWLINIRHDIAHDHKLPSVSILELGLNQCLEWIKIKYWQVQNKIIRDYTVTESLWNSKVVEILDIYVELNLKLFSKNTDISEYDEDIIERIDSIIFKEVPQPTTDISDIIGALEEYLNVSFTKPISDGDKEQVSKILINGLLSIETETSPKGTRVIPKDFRNIWSNLLNMLNDNNFISLIINKLIDVTNTVELENAIRETAALWISELLLGLRKAQLVREELNSIENNDPAQLDKISISKIKSDLEEKYPQYEDCLQFSSTSILCDGNTFQDKIVATPNSYTLHFLEEVLRYNKNSENYISDIVTLVKKMLLPRGPKTDGEIFTVDDLENINVLKNRNTDMADSEETIIVNGNTNATEVEGARWKPVKDTTIFKDCPLGVLPHQSRIKNPLLAI
ncbi:uncharacterized protein LOC108915678 [Anoplophora glabripennis]|uniref:uncharacterized protein LOC108915678 n=1 Tax=Anoplophora glabripennis TaxID=217634 RepID=UPI000873A3F9|nr:uncharacterized protein LOC108915678 [Anoplophora glabripennis]